MTSYEVTVPFLHFVRVEAPSRTAAAEIAAAGGGDLIDEERDRRWDVSRYDVLDVDETHEDPPDDDDDTEEINRHGRRDLDLRGRGPLPGVRVAGAAVDPSGGATAPLLDVQTRRAGVARCLTA